MRRWLSHLSTRVSSGVASWWSVTVGALVAGIALSTIVFFGAASAGGDAPTEAKDSAAGRAVFIAITLVVIVVAVVLSLKYRKR